jgi:RNA polymerase sigma-70 factor (ECF subfamily)
MPREADRIRAAQAGSHEAFQTLLERYHLLALWTAQILLGDAHMVEDVAQEAWVNAWRALVSFDLERPFRPWLLRIVTNCCRMEQWRRTSRAAPDRVEVSPPAAADDDILAGVIQREEFAALDAVIASLPAAQRQLVELRYHADHELSEIALVMSLPIGTEKSRLHRAMALIRRRMAQSNVAMTGEIRNGNTQRLHQGYAAKCERKPSQPGGDRARWQPLVCR